MTAESHIIQTVTSMLPIEIKVSPEQNLKDDLGIDSFKIVEIIIAIEDLLNIRFPPSILDSNKIITVSDLIKISNQILEEKNAV